MPRHFGPACDPHDLRSIPSAVKMPEAGLLNRQARLTITGSLAGLIPARIAAIVHDPQADTHACGQRNRHVIIQDGSRRGKNGPPDQPGEQLIRFHAEHQCEARNRNRAVDENIPHGIKRLMAVCRRFIGMARFLLPSGPDEKTASDKAMMRPSRRQWPGAPVHLRPPGKRSTPNGCQGPPSCGGFPGKSVPWRGPPRT